MTTRDDAPRDPMPPPVASPPPREPTPDFLHHFALAIRGGASPANAAEWAGVPPWTLKKWLKRNGPLYDTLRTTQRSALAHVKVKLQLEVAKRSPEKALRRLQVRDEQADAGRDASRSPRPYTKAGQTVDGVAAADHRQCDPRVS